MHPAAAAVHPAAAAVHVAATGRTAAAGVTAVLFVCLCCPSKALPVAASRAASSDRCHRLDPLCRAPKNLPVTVTTLPRQPRRSRQSRGRSVGCEACLIPIRCQPLFKDRMPNGTEMGRAGSVVSPAAVRLNCKDAVAASGSHWLLRREQAMHGSSGPGWVNRVVQRNGRGRVVHQRQWARPPHLRVKTANHTAATMFRTAKVCCCPELVPNWRRYSIPNATDTAR